MLGTALPVVVGALSDQSWWRGALLGLLGALLAIGLPYAVIVRGLRAGRMGDHHVTRRQDRPKVLAVTLGGLGLGLALLWLLGAPGELLGLLVGMVVLVLVCLAISTRWKVSLHAAATAGSLAVLVELVGLWALVESVVVAVVAGVAWSRVVLFDHTWAQVVVGAVVGAVVLPLVLALA